MIPGRAGWEVVAGAIASVGARDVVDLACGDGAVPRWLVEEAGVASVLALDRDPGALEHAREAADRAGGPQAWIRYEQADLEQATLPFEAYDLAWAPTVLDATDDPVRMSRMVRAGLRPRGVLLATVPAAAAAHVEGTLGRALLEEPSTVPLPGGEVLITARKPPRRRP